MDKGIELVDDALGAMDDIDEFLLKNKVTLKKPLKQMSVVELKLF